MTEKRSAGLRRGEDQDDRWRRYVLRLRSEPRPFEDQWSFFCDNYADRPQRDGPPLVWQPDPESLPQTNIGRFMNERGIGSYEELHRWSVEKRGEFWGELVRRLGIVFGQSPGEILDLSKGVTQPRWLPGAELNIVDSCFRAEADHVAVVSGRAGTDEIEKTSYGELERLVNRFANGLRRHGFRPGDPIALYMPMNLDCVVAYLGIVRAGCSVVSIADSFSPEEVRKRLTLGGARGLVTVESFERAGRTIRLLEKAQEADAPQTIVRAIRADAFKFLRDGDFLWEDLIDANDRFESRVGDPNLVTNVLFSSGTTGTPKAIPWTHLTPIKCAMDAYFHQDVHPGDRLAWPTNIGWMMGPWLIYAALVNRATIALYEGIPTAEGFARFIRDAEVDILGVVPSLVRAWQAVDRFEEVDWSRIRLFSSTGEPSNQKDYLWLMSLTGYRAPVIEYCGGTEIGGGYITGTVVQPASPATFTTPALGLEMVVFDEKVQRVGDDGMGEAYLVPPSIGLSQTLLNADHEEVYHAGCPTGPNGTTLRRHGDQITRLAKGFYKAQGRADDTMNLGGIKVSSLELERVIERHERIHECAAIAVQPEGEGPERLVIHAIATEGADRARLAEELGASIAKAINPLFKIHDLVLVEDLPRTATNKLMRRSLRKRYMDRDLSRPGETGK